MYSAFLNNILMGVGGTEEEAVADAVAEYERTAGYGGYPEFDSRDDFLAALDVEEDTE